MNPNSQVADLIMQLMSRGRAGGMPMNASPELTQYLAHAQAGSAPPQMRGRPSAEVIQGPGSGAGAVTQPFDFESAPTSMLRPNDPSVSQFTQDQTTALDMVGAPRPAPGAGAMGDADQTFIWYTNPQTGKRVRLDGPFFDDIAAARAMRELRDAGMTDELEISPY